VDRERAKELLPIIQAFAEGKTIETRGGPGGEWHRVKTDWELPFDLECEYRIKPEPREFWVQPDCQVVNDLHERPLDFEGWIKVREVLDD